MFPPIALVLLYQPSDRWSLRHGGYHLAQVVSTSGSRSYQALASRHPQTGSTTRLRWRDASRWFSNVSCACITMGREYKAMERQICHHCESFLIPLLTTEN
jgi:hypothetical protein